MEELRDELGRRLRYFGSHSDTLGLFTDVDFQIVYPVALGTALQLTVTVVPVGAVQTAVIPPGIAGAVPADASAALLAARPMPQLAPAALATTRKRPTASTRATRR